MRIVVQILLVAAVVGCATTPSTLERLELPADHAFVIPEYPAWQFSGRVSIVKDQEGWHAGLNWREVEGRYRLKISGPLGQGAVQIDGDMTGVRLQTAEGDDFVADDADSLIETVTGWQFPVKGIRYWVRGVPAPAVPATIDTDGNGRLARLEQSGWVVSYSRFQTLDGRDWPTRMRLISTDVSVRLVVDQWKLSADPVAGDSVVPAEQIP